MIISHNMMAMNAMRQYNMVTGSKQKNTEKLSSGYKINRAADDAAGLAISEKMRRQVRGLTQASSNVQEGIGFVQVADGALDEIDDMLQRINELSVKAANDTLQDDDRAYINEEIQQIKAEMNRVFADTTFNDRKIWDTNTLDKKLIGYEKKQAATVTSSTNYFDVTNENSGIMPKSTSSWGYINVNADASGVGFSWTGSDGNTYTTKKIDWNEFEEKNYSINASSLYDDPKFFAADGTTPLLDFTYSVNPITDATSTDIANTINGTSVTIYRYSPVEARFEDTAGNQVSGTYTTGAYASLDYYVAYDSQINGTTNPYSFDKGSDGVIEPKLTATSGNMTVIPSYSDVSAAKSDSTGFKFQFEMDGIGTITAESDRLSYSVNVGRAEYEGIWWDWVYPSHGARYQGVHTYTTTGDLAGLMGMLTDNGTKPGVLSAANGGSSEDGGNATLHFDLKSGSDTIGSMNISIKVQASDTEQSVLDKIKSSFNNSTIIDLYTTDADEQSRYGGQSNTGNYHSNIINTPVYSATNSLQIQAGSEAGQYIKIDYDALSVHVLKMQDTNVKTQKDAEKAIDEVKYAMQVVNGQRADFGAYQNRLEHTYKNLDNVVENTTAAESQIRDTDMAKAMVQQSLMNILEQAGASMLAQANQSPQGVMTLLG